MSAAMIAWHAQHEPNRLAMKHGARHLTYQLAHQQLQRIAAGLLSARVTERRLVAVAHSDPLVETLLLLALEALGVATLPFMQPADAGIVTALRDCDLIVCEQQVPGLSVPYALISREWLAAAVRTNVTHELPLRRFAEHEMVNVFTTSGSMGTAKAIVFDARALDARITSRLWQYGLDRHSRLLAAMPPSTSSTYFVAQALFRVAGTLVFFDEATVSADLTDCSHALMLPALLHRVASAAHDIARPQQPIKILAVGAKLSPATRELAAGKLNAVVIEAYGTTETGWLAMFNGESTGDVLPGVEVEVVDGNDRPLAHGTSGQIRARSPEMGSGYLDPVLSSAVFRDGWYYTGDFGVMERPGRIELIGREDAMMNLGGIKISPERIEEVLTAHAIAADVAVLARVNPEGIDELYLACVSPRVLGAALDEELVSALGHNLGSIKVVIISKMPRNAAGKLRRAEVRAMVEKHLAQ